MKSDGTALESFITTIKGMDILTYVGNVNVKSRRFENMEEPTGAKMIARGEIVREKVERELRVFPPSKGDDTQGVLWFWARYQSENVEAIVEFLRCKRDNRKMPDWVYPKILMLTDIETYRRRRQEIQHPERIAIAEGRMSLEESQYMPKEKTLRKRERNEEAYRHRFGRGMTLYDYGFEK